LIHQMERLEAMAIIVQKKSKTSAKDALSMWEVLLSFISPLMGGYGDSDNLLSSNVTLRSLLETCSEAIIVASWMCEPLIENNGDDVSDEIKNLSKLLTDAQRLLTACKLGRVEEKRLLDEKNKEESVLSSKESQSDLEKKSALRLECAIETSRCRAEIDSVLDTDEVDINALTAIARKATIAATGGFKNISDCNSPILSATSSKALFGNPYLNFLSVWSGMYLSPWPFCNVGQARTILKQARDALRLASKYWGRRSSNLEEVLLDIGEADLENGLLGGNADAAGQLYRQALAKLEGKDGDDVSMNDFVRGKLKAQCLIGLAKQRLSTGDSEVAETHARSALDLLLSSDPTLQQGDVPTLLCSYSWSAPTLNQLSYSHQLCSSRQLVAEACIQSSRFDDARSFLTDAVKEVPGNFDAAFSLASFHLRMQCLRNDSDENETRKSLLRAAKMDTSKASPFALLGIWYESKNDTKRAEGCYQKALSLDSSHPVAGRGLRRLLELKDLVPHCKRAIEQNSPVNGWAWQALGQHKVANEGDDTTAVICFQQALRCRDVQNPGSDMQGAFYSYPEMTADAHSEASMTWVELASCYRRMGKYSAALRAYEEAASTGTLPPAALCSWAQCDLDLGLYDEAAEKCDNVLACDDCSAELNRMAAYIMAEALLSTARKDIQGGKNGSCRSHLEKAITRLEGLCAQNSTYCEIKLLGDLYSFGEALPSYVFDPKVSSGGEQDADIRLPKEVEDKISFIRKGEEAYAQALELVTRIDGEEEDKSFLLAATGTDLGINLLSQARVIAVALGDGSGGDAKTAIADLAAESDRVRDLVLRSVNAFSQAIDHSPNDAAAWCGLGSALIFVDPLLSQHAFCRALQIDKSIAEPLSSIALLYADYDKTGKSAEVLDALTQLEDTPLMWIGRGLLLEKTSRAWHDSPASREGCLTRASDAYRASLQIMQHPAALLGLSLTCRRADADVQTSNDQVYSSLADRSSKIESRISMTLHQSCTGGGNIGASVIDGLFRIEEGLEVLDSSEASRIIKEGIEGIERARSRSSSKMSQDIGSSVTKCEIDLPSPASLQKKNYGEFPNDCIEKSLNQASTDFVQDTSAALHEDSLDKARNTVVLNPDSGDSWLRLAKELTQAAVRSTDDAATSETLSSAKTAADKALDLLKDQLLNACLIAPRRKAVHHENLIEYSEKSVVSAIPPSSLVSDAMSLVSWLGSMDEENQSRRDSVTSFQESLLLDPLNKVAAAALGL
jgi:tetratricopeptide (TPR) repeat protein